MKNLLFSFLAVLLFSFAASADPVDIGVIESDLNVECVDFAIDNTNVVVADVLLVKSIERQESVSKELTVEQSNYYSYQLEIVNEVLVIPLGRYLHANVGYKLKTNYNSNILGTITYTDRQISLDGESSNPLDPGRQVMLSV